MVFLDGKGNLKVAKITSKAFVGPLAGAVTLPSYLTANLPASANVGTVVYVTDGASGGAPCLAVKTAAGWKQVSLVALGS